MLVSQLVPVSKLPLLSKSTSGMLLRELLVMLSARTSAWDLLACLVRVRVPSSRLACTSATRIPTCSLKICVKLALLLAERQQLLQNISPHVAPHHHFSSLETCVSVRSLHLICNHSMPPLTRQKQVPYCTRCPLFGARASIGLSLAMHRL